MPDYHKKPFDSDYDGTNLDTAGSFLLGGVGGTLGYALGGKTGLSLGAATGRFLGEGLGDWFADLIGARDMNAPAAKHEAMSREEATLAGLSVGLSRVPDDTLRGGFGAMSKK